jgi:hypothetical protein
VGKAREKHRKSHRGDVDSTIQSRKRYFLGFTLTGIQTLGSKAYQSGLHSGGNYTYSGAG